MTAGEDWVRLFRQGSGLVCMFHRKIGVAFARLSEADIFLKKELSRLYVVEVGDYNLEEWSVDLFELH